MRLDRRFIVVVTISLGWAFLVSAVFYHFARNSGRRSAPKLKPVVMAAKALEVGAVIKPDALKLVQVPEESFPKGGFSRVEDIVDRPVISPVLPDEPVVEGRLGARGSGAGVAPLIPPGMRAISVRVNDVIGVASPMTGRRNLSIHRRARPLVDCGGCPARTRRSTMRTDFPAATRSRAATCPAYPPPAISTS